MIVYRLCKGKYKNDLSGKGAELAGGRWNSKGMALLYTSSNIALCTTEIAVHAPLGITPKNYFLLTIELPSTNIDEVSVLDLSRGWRSSPPIPETKYLGDEFIRKSSYLILKVPSAVVQGEYNYLINPRHRKFTEVTIIKIEPFEFDRRLFEE